MAEVIFKNMQCLRRIVELSAGGNYSNHGTANNYNNRVNELGIANTNNSIINNIRATTYISTSDTVDNISGSETISLLQPLVTNTTESVERVFQWKIGIEAPAKIFTFGKTSGQAMYKLLELNILLTNSCFRVFDVKPVAINATVCRSYFGISAKSKSKAFPSIKEEVFKFVSRNCVQSDGTIKCLINRAIAVELPSLCMEWPTRNAAVYDISDSILLSIPFFLSDVYLF